MNKPLVAMSGALLTSAWVCCSAMGQVMVHMIPDLRPSSTGYEALSGDGSSVIGLLPDGSAGRWRVSSGVTALGSFVPYGISRSGDVVCGTAGVFDGEPVAVRWTSREGMTPAPVPEGTVRSWAFGVSSNGTNVAGGLSQAVDPSAAVLRALGGQSSWSIIQVPPESYFSIARCVSDFGSVAGNSVMTLPNGTSLKQAFWAEFSVAIPLEGPSGSQSYIWDAGKSVNIFVGVVPLPNDPFSFSIGIPHQACVWTYGGGPSILPPLPGAARADARATSEWGTVIVGTSLVAGIGDRATAWIDSQPLDLTQYLDCLGYAELSGVLTSAFGVSDDGSSIVARRSDGRMILVTGFTSTSVRSTDINRDGGVDGSDLTLLLSAWGTNGQGHHDADVNNDGIVNGQDLAYLLGGWAPCQ